MKCFVCKSHMHPSSVNRVVNLSESIIIAKDVPAFVCFQCGESYYEDDIVEKLEVIINNLKRVLSEIVVVKFADKVA